MIPPTVNEVASALAGGTVGVMGTLLVLEVLRQRVSTYFYIFMKMENSVDRFRKCVSVLIAEVYEGYLVDYAMELALFPTQVVCLPNQTVRIVVVKA
jgi:hypothetical protein